MPLSLRTATRMNRLAHAAGRQVLSFPRSCTSLPRARTPITASLWRSTDLNAVVVANSNPHEPLGPSSRKTGIVVSEIMYKPAARADTNNCEFVEIYNSQPYFHDISGYQI